MASQVVPCFPCPVPLHLLAQQASSDLSQPTLTTERGRGDYTRVSSLRPPLLRGAPTSAGMPQTDLRPSVPRLASGKNPVTATTSRDTDATVYKTLGMWPPRHHWRCGP